jgi:hypothetical protein
MYNRNAFWYIVLSNTAIVHNDILFHPFREEMFQRVDDPTVHPSLVALPIHLFDPCQTFSPLVLLQHPGDPLGYRGRCVGRAAGVEYALHGVEMSQEKASEVVLVGVEVGPQVAVQQLIYSGVSDTTRQIISSKPFISFIQLDLQF